MSQLDIIDIWRDRYPEKVEFSWNRTSINGRSASRIDRFLISRPLLCNVIKCEYSNYPHSDHNFSELRLNLDQVPQGPSYWIFNNSLINDEDYHNRIRNLIHDYKHCSNYNVDFIEWYENLKMKIKSESIAFSKRKAREYRKKESKLTKQIDYEKIKAHKYADYDTCRLKKLEDEMNNISIDKLRGVAIRSKILWYEEGENSTKFFLNLEKSRQKKKVIRQILTDNGHLIHDQTLIINEQLRFYAELYSGTSTDDDSRVEMLNELSKSLSPADANLCELEITANELKVALFAMDSNKSPGLDGLTAEFYKAFWYDFEDIFEKLTHEIFIRDKD